MILLILFIILFVSALLLEGIMLPLFRIPLKANAVRLIAANLAAQAIMTLTAGRALINNGPAGALISGFIAGFILILVRTLVYEQILTAKSNKRILSFGLLASFVVLGAFMAALGPLHRLILHLT